MSPGAAERAPIPAPNDLDDDDLDIGLSPLDSPDDRPPEPEARPAGPGGENRRVTREDIKQKMGRVMDPLLERIMRSRDSLSDEDAREHAQQIYDDFFPLGERILPVIEHEVQPEGQETSQSELDQLDIDMDRWIREARTFLQSNPTAAPEQPPPGQPQSLPVPPPLVAPDAQRPNVTDTERREANSLADNILTAMRDEERNRLIERGLDGAGFFKSVFFPGKVVSEIDTADAQGNRRYDASPEIEAMIREYALQLVTNQQITASGNEVFRLMQSRGFVIDLNRNGQFVPQHADSSWLNRLVHFDRSKTTGLNFLGGMAIGYTAKRTLSHLVSTLAPLAGGLGAAIGIGTVIGAGSGALVGKREGSEATSSGESWTSELDAALATSQEGQIRLACHKIEKIFNDPRANREFFRGRTRMEASRVLQRYREGIRRLALIEMSRNVARERDAREGFGSEQERDAFVAEKYAQFCRTMAQGEGQVMTSFGNSYSQALLREVGIIAEDVGGSQVPGTRADADVVPNAPGINPADQNIRRQIEAGYARDTQIRRRQRQRIVATSVVRGAIMGAGAGAVGWYVGNWFAGLIDPHHGAAVAGAGAHADVPGGHSGVGPEGMGHTPFFTNDNTMPEQGFTVEHAQQLGFGELMNDQRCPTAFLDGHAFVGTDQGAALREAVLLWRDDLNLHDMNPEHLANLMNFAGSPDSAVPHDSGAGYHIMREQVQAIIDHVWNNGEVAEANIFDANQIMVDQAMRSASEAAGTVAPATAAAAGETAKGIWPGWLLLAGATGWAAGYGADSARRNDQIRATNQMPANLAGRNVSARAGAGSFAGVGSFPAAPQAPAEPAAPAPAAAPTRPQAAPVAPAPAPPAQARTEAPEATVDDGTRDEAALRTERDRIQSENNNIEQALGIEGLISRDDSVFAELGRIPEKEGRTRVLAYALSERRVQAGYAVPEIDAAWPGEANESRRIAEYAIWDWYKAEELVDLFDQRETGRRRISEIDIEITRRQNETEGRDATDRTGELLNDQEIDRLMEKLQLPITEYQGQRLTKEFLREKDLIPKYEIIVGDQRVWSSSNNFTFDGRTGGIAYIENGENVIALPYMTSNSQGNIRYYPGFEVRGSGPNERIYWFDKGRGEASLAIPISIQAALGKVQFGAANLTENEAGLILVGLTQKYSQTSSPGEQQARRREVADASGVNETPQRINGISGDGMEQFSGSPEDINLTDPQDKPDFSTVVESWEKEIPSYGGQVTFEAFRSVNNKYLFLFGRDIRGRAWIAQIEVVRSLINGRGLKTDWVEAGVLTTPANEYPAQLESADRKRYYQRPIPGTLYYDAYEKFVSKIPIVKEYVGSLAARPQTG